MSRSKFELSPALSGMMNRRRALKIGGTGFLSGLTLPSLLQCEAIAGTGVAPSAKSCIFLYLQGGPSTIDMWDLKPDAPSEIRGPYLPIPTNVSGTFVGEHCHRCAKVADKFTILRSHSHNDNGHVTGSHYVFTGNRANFADGANSRIPVNELYPSCGSIVSRELGVRGSVPPYINMPHPLAGGGPGFYGAEHAPFVIESDPVQPDFEVKDLHPDERIGVIRQQKRERTLRALSRRNQRQSVERRRWQTYYEKARELVNSAGRSQGIRLASRTRETAGRLRTHVTRPMCAPRSATGRSRLPIRRSRSRQLGYSFFLFPKPGEGSDPSRRSGIQCAGDRPGRSRTARQHAGDHDG